MFTYRIEKIIFSGGKIGMQIEANPDDILNLINGKYEDLIM